SLAGAGAGALFVGPEKTGPERRRSSASSAFDFPPGGGAPSPLATRLEGPCGGGGAGGGPPSARSMSEAAAGGRGATRPHGGSFISPCAVLSLAARAVFSGCVRADKIRA